MEENPIYTFVKWQVKDNQLDTVLSLLAKVAKETRKETGNLFYKIHQGDADKNTLILFEGYNDRSGLDAHRNSIHYKTIVAGQIAPLLETRDVITASEILQPL